MTKLSVHQRKARDFIQREDWGNALSELERMVEADGSNPTLHNQIGDVYLRKDEVEEACSHFERAIELYATVGLHNNAVALCKKVLRLRPGRNDVRFRLARLRLEQGFRSEAAIFFADYLDHIHPRNDSGGAELEERCREMVELIPDEAPVGKILEKLESSERFACAFEIVHRYAKLAADSGDTATARRYSEKMRSLRVLAERNGGRDLLANDPVLDEVAVPGAMLEIEEPEPTPAAPVRQGPGRTSGVAATSYVEPGRVDLPHAAPKTPFVDMPRVAETRSTAADPAEATPGRSANEGLEFDIDVASLEAPRGAPASDAAFGAEAFDTFDGLPLLAPRPVPAPKKLAEKAAVPPSEPIETSADGFLLHEDASEFDSSPTEALPGNFTPLLQPEGGFDSGPSETLDGVDDGATAAESRDEVPAGDRGILEVEAGGTNGNGSHDLTQAEPARTSKGPANWIESLRHSPVWIPHGETLTSPQESAPDSGTNMELEQVIDSFRDQMARALDGDGAARYDLGVAYYDMGLYNEALAEFEAAARCSGLEIRSFEMQAACLLQTERYAEVVQLLAPVMTASGAASRHQLGLHYVLGQAFEALGDRTGARRHFEEVALVDIDFKDVQARLQRVS